MSTQSPIPPVPAEEVWRVALTLANNLCVRISDRHRDNDENREASAAAACAESIRGYMTLDRVFLRELLIEGGAIPDSWGEK